MNSRTTIRFAGLLALLALMLSGCALGPHYRAPDLDLPAAWPANEVLDAQKRDDPDAGDDWMHWWVRFGDPDLDELVNRAVADNLDIRMQAARIQEARARLGFSTADQFPTVGFQADAVRQRSSGAVSGAPHNQGTTANLFNLAGVLNYEVDIWGRVAREREASAALLRESGLTHDAVRLSVITEVVATYFNLKAAQRELEITSEALNILEETYRLQTVRFRYGEIDELILRQAETELEATRALLPPRIGQVRRLEGALGILTGLSPAELMAEREYDARDLTQIRNPELVPPVLPSELLLRRPDIRAAEASLQAASARIGIAQAQRLPRLNLAALLGANALEIDDLFGSSAQVWNLGIGAAGPLLDFGRNKARVETARAQYLQAETGYMTTVNLAFNEARDALVLHQSTMDQVEAVSRQLAIAWRTEELANIRYRQGLIRFIEFLDAHRSRLAAEQNLNNALRDRLTATATLFKALGGGWG